MKKQALAAAMLLLATGVSASTPASAQGWRDIVGGFTGANRIDSRYDSRTNYYDVRDRLDRVQSRLQRAMNSGLIGQRRFVMLNNRIQDLRAQTTRNRGWVNRNNVMDELASIEDSLRASIANRRGSNWY